MTPDQIEQMEKLAKQFGATMRDGRLSFDTGGGYTGNPDNRKLWLEAAGPLGKLYGWTLLEQHLAAHLEALEEAHRQNTKYLREELRKARRTITALNKAVPK